jgi:hypothetical protein
METVEDPGEPNLQDKKGEHHDDDVHGLEGKRRPQYERRRERFEALIQS